MKNRSKVDDARDSDRMFVTALARGLQILRTFAESAAELGTSDIARLTKLPQPTVWRLCHTLAELGFLTRTPGTDKLRLGIPVLGLGYAVLATYPLAELARPYMQEIASRYRGAVSLGARDGLNMIYLQRCVGSAIVLGDLRVGSPIPLAYSATGWAYLAALGGSGRKKLLSEIQKAEGARWRQTRPLLDAALKKYEKTGYVMSKGVLHPEINAVAVPIRSQDGSLLLSISSGGISQIFTEPVLQDVGRDLIKLAGELSIWLNAQDESTVSLSRHVAAL